MIMPTYIEPRILVLEGLFSSLLDTIDAAGGHADEIGPWELDKVEEKLSSGDYHGMILTGGSDISPKLYNAKPHKETCGVDMLRDTGEYFALTLATQLGIPVLGICRGSQIMAAFRGGKLKQHIEGHRGGEHNVYALPEGKTFKRAINSRDMNVVSLHHQEVVKPGRDMLIAARAADGVVEAIESKDGKWLGCQFHPEMNALQNGNSFGIFQWLVAEAAKFTGGRVKAVRFRDVKRAPATWRPLTPKSIVKKSRAAGEPTMPGIAHATYQEGTASATSALLYSCGDCGMLFDYQSDRDDHEAYLHRGEGLALARYPELEPPAGHLAYDE